MITSDDTHMSTCGTSVYDTVYGAGDEGRQGETAQRSHNWVSEELILKLRKSKESVGCHGALCGMLRGTRIQPASLNDILTSVHAMSQMARHDAIRM